MTMNRKSFFIVLSLLILPVTATAKEEWKQFCSTEQRFEQLKVFSQKIRQIEQKKKTGGIHFQEVATLLGEPNDKNDKTIQAGKGQEVWLYKHPCFTTVRFLFMFNMDGQLEEIKSVLNTPGVNEGNDIFYHADRFLPKNKPQNDSKS